MVELSLPPSLPPSLPHCSDSFFPSILLLTYMYMYLFSAVESSSSMKQISQESKVHSRSSSTPVLTYPTHFNISTLLEHLFHFLATGKTAMGLPSSGDKDARILCRAGKKSRVLAPNQHKCIVDRDLVHKRMIRASPSDSCPVCMSMHSPLPHILVCRGMCR